MYLERMVPGVSSRIFNGTTPYSTKVLPPDVPFPLLFFPLLLKLIAAKARLSSKVPALGRVLAHPLCVDLISGRSEKR